MSFEKDWLRAIEMTPRVFDEQDFLWPLRPGEYSKWEYVANELWPTSGYFRIRGRQCEIVVQRRPPYCDRGRVLAHLETFGEFTRNIDGADGWDRYYFNLTYAFEEIEEWMRCRDQLVAKDEIVR